MGRLPNKAYEQLQKLMKDEPDAWATDNMKVEAVVAKIRAELVSNHGRDVATAAVDITIESARKYLKAHKKSLENTKKRPAGHRMVYATTSSVPLPVLDSLKDGIESLLSGNFGIVFASDGLRAAEGILLTQLCGNRIACFLLAYSFFSVLAGFYFQSFENWKCGASPSTIMLRFHAQFSIWQTTGAAMDVWKGVVCNLLFGLLVGSTNHQFMLAQVSTICKDIFLSNLRSMIVEKPTLPKHGDFPMLTDLENTQKVYYVSGVLIRKIKRANVFCEESTKILIRLLTDNQEELPDGSQQLLILAAAYTHRVDRGFLFEASFAFFIFVAEMERRVCWFLTSEHYRLYLSSIMEWTRTSLLADNVLKGKFRTACLSQAPQASSSASSSTSMTLTDAQLRKTFEFVVDKYVTIRMHYSLKYYVDEEEFAAKGKMKAPAKKVKTRAKGLKAREESSK